jgi:hypothetical protein
MKRFAGTLIALGTTAAFLVVWGGVAAGAASDDEKHMLPKSGTAELRDVELGHFLTECPQGGRGLDDRPQPLDRRTIDEVEKQSSRGDDRRTNQDYSCFPQNETSVDVNPRRNQNIVGGANDYRLGTGSSGFYASTDGGKNWYDGIIPFPSAPAGQSRGEGFIPSGGDPIIAFDRAGVAYYGMIGFFRGDDTNGVFVSRSSNGGFTWSRARIGGSNTPTPAPGPNTDPRQPGDGVVDFLPDNDLVFNGSVPFNDKPYMTTGPRPAGVQPQCFDPAHSPVACGDPATIGVDRVYVTWTTFGQATGAFSRITLSYSDDQGRSWSPKKTISGSAPFCIGAADGSNECSFDQGSTPTVNPTNGHLYVSFLNGNTPDENQYLLVRSKDGGETFEGPFFITSIFDINYPRANATRPDCINRGAQTRSTLTNSCFRVNSYGNVVVDRRGGAFANDLYAVISDNRNGNPASSNVDVFIFKSTDGGDTWLGPTRVNNDNSVPAPDRDCGRTPGFLPVGDVTTPCGGVGNFGNDQWFPWVDISSRGTLNVVFFDRRNDVSSTAAEWPTTRAAGRPGNYLAWFFGAVCEVNSTATVPPTGTSIPSGAKDCLANQAAIIRQPTSEVDPGANPVPGQNQTGLPFKNFQVSDTPFNLDYAFRAGIFVGDYNNVGIADGDNTAVGFWTDARNGRSSGGPAGGVTNPSEVGRNPACEQSDVFIDQWNAENGDNGSGSTLPNDSPFLVTPCPPAQKDRKSSSRR